MRKSVRGPERGKRGEGQRSRGQGGIEARQDLPAEAIMTNPGFDGGAGFRGPWRLAPRHWWLVAAGSIGGALIAGMATFFLPDVWEATAIVRIGQVGQIGSQGQIGEVLIEAPADAVERLRSLAFQSKVAEALNLDVKVFSASVTVLQLRNSGFVGLKVRDRARERAIGNATALVRTLSSRHGEIAKPRIEVLERQLATLRARIGRVEEALEHLSTRMRGLDGSPLLLETYLRKNEELLTLRQQESVLISALTAPATLPTHAIEEVYAPPAPAFPRLSMMLPLGLLGGSVAGVAWAIALTGRRRGTTVGQENGTRA